MGVLKDVHPQWENQIWKRLRFLKQDCQKVQKMERLFVISIHYVADIAAQLS